MVIWGKETKWRLMGDVADKRNSNGRNRIYEIRLSKIRISWIIQIIRIIQLNFFRSTAQFYILINWIYKILTSLI